MSDQPGDDRTKQPEPEPGVIREYIGTGAFWRFLALFLVITGIVIALAQNTREVRFDWLWLEARPPLFVVLLATALASAFLTEVSTALWRRQRRRRRTEREELKRARGGRKG